MTSNLDNTNIFEARVMVFDFDGVVCDSTNECMVTAWNTWERWSNSDRFRCDLSKFTNSDKESFRKLRPYVRGAGEYLGNKQSGINHNFKLATPEDAINNYPLIKESHKRLDLLDEKSKSKLIKRWGKESSETIQL